MSINIGIKLISETARIPTKATSGSAGFDVFCPKKVTINPGERLLIGAGFHVAIPDGYELQVRSRSGLALKTGIIVLNQPGTIDSDYIDKEVGIILLHTGSTIHTFDIGDRIAQLVPAELIKANLINLSVPRLNTLELLEMENGLCAKTTRNGGFGSTGK